MFYWHTCLYYVIAMSVLLRILGGGENGYLMHRNLKFYACTQTKCHIHTLFTSKINEQSFNLEKREYRDGIKQDWNGGILVML